MRVVAEMDFHTPRNPCVDLWGKFKSSQWTFLTQVTCLPWFKLRAQKETFSRPRELGWFSVPHLETWTSGHRPPTG